ncbi:unnamed protein product [Arctogadus glacialis]
MFLFHTSAVSSAPRPASGGSTAPALHCHVATVTTCASKAASASRSRKAGPVCSVARCSDHRELEGGGRSTNSLSDHRELEDQTASVTTESWRTKQPQ